MRWRLKGVVQKALSVTPGGQRMNDLLQRTVGAFRRFDSELEGKIEDFGLMAKQLRQTGISIAGQGLLEIGTGWYPTLPVCLYLVGAGSVVTVDLVRHLQPDLLRRMVDRLGERSGWLADVAGVDDAGVRARHERLRASLQAGERDLGRASAGVIDYRAPGDAAHTDLPDESVDVVFSNSVLEHIPVTVLDAIFAESRRILRPGGVVFHSVNCGDHYAYTDPGINQLNYLRFGQRRWELLWNNALQYQNRLRAIDFLDLARKHGLDIVRENTAQQLDRRLPELRAIPIAREFARYTPEQLCVTTVDFIARK